MSNDACIPPSLALNHLTTATKVVANFYIKLTQYDDEMPKRSGTNPVWCDGKSTYGENMFFRNPRDAWNNMR